MKYKMHDLNEKCMASNKNNALIFEFVHINKI